MPTGTVSDSSGPRTRPVDAGPTRQSSSGDESGRHRPHERDFRNVDSHGHEQSRRPTDDDAGQSQSPEKRIAALEAEVESLQARLAKSQATRQELVDRYEYALRVREQAPTPSERRQQPASTNATRESRSSLSSLSTRVANAVEPAVRTVRESVGRLAEKISSRR